MTRRGRSSWEAWTVWTLITSSISPEILTSANHSGSGSGSSHWAWPHSLFLVLLFLPSRAAPSEAVC